MTTGPTQESSPTGIRAIPRILSRILDATEVTVLCSAISLLAIFILLNVFARFFHQSIYFVEELSKFLIILITFVGASYATRRARHIRMGAFLDMMPAWLEKVFVIFISVVSAWVFFVMAFHAWSYMMEVKAMGQTTSALRAPYWIFLVIVPIGFFASGVQCLRTVLKNIVEKEVWLSADQQSEYEELLEGEDA
ncbi:TRAP transporter small permease [Kiritimatiellaeota bacterium B1221]|nr:TRAP transporter small permease [Kiritimatiellaeota bacterium B1221]